MLNSTPIVILHFPGAPPGGLVFCEPSAVLTASAAGEVRGVLAAASAHVARGGYAAGFLAYEAAPAFDEALVVRNGGNIPLAWFGLFDSPVPEDAYLETPGRACADWTPEITRAEYEAAFGRIMRGIEAGETYQVNGTFRLRGRLTPYAPPPLRRGPRGGSPLAYFRTLYASHPAAYAAYIDTGDHAILSVSPELLFEQDGARLTTRPMKGTRRRGRYTVEDEAVAAELAGSPKDRAENVMIVDLMRNDFGKIAQVGSVRAERLFDVERLPTVWQMTSTVTCEVDDRVGFADVLGAVFPAGSVTGAPKAKAMQVIAEIEKSPRNIYCGAIGYAAPRRRAVFNVAIRTVLIDKQTGEAECGVGGGITVGSVCAAEYEEAMDKSRFLTSAQEPFDLLETLRLEDGAYFLRERHMSRLMEAAAYFGCPVDAVRVAEALDAFASAHSRGLHRVRLTVDRTGEPAITSRPLEETVGVQKAVLAPSPIDTGSPFEFHKTTRREKYDAFRAASPPDAFDVLLWNARGELTEFTNGNLVVRRDGALLTPPVSCGLLAGTFRAELLATGRVAEAVLRVEYLVTFDEVWFVNSVRKWVPVAGEWTRAL